MSITLTASPGAIEFSSDARVTVTVEVVAQRGVTLADDGERGNVDEYERTLREGDRRFEYRAALLSKTEAAPAPDGKLRWVYRFELEFFLPGEYELPAASVAFVEVRGEEGNPDRETPGEVRKARTEPLTIDVRAPGEAPLFEGELTEIPVLPPIELPSAWSRYWWVAPPLALVVVALALLLLRRARTRHADRVVVTLPHEWARCQLAALLAEDLVGKGLMQEFHYRISGIVRGYIERRFHVSAPDMTTEEFLAEVAADRRFTALLQVAAVGPGSRPDSIGGPTSSSGSAALEHPVGQVRETIATGLQHFLTACDLVKYARQEPTRAECDAAFEAAGAFVERTRDPQPQAWQSPPPHARADSSEPRVSARADGRAAGLGFDATGTPREDRTP